MPAKDDILKTRRKMLETPPHEGAGLQNQPTTAQAGQNIEPSDTSAPNTGTVAGGSQPKQQVAVPDTAKQSQTAPATTASQQTAQPTTQPLATPTTAQATKKNPSKETEQQQSALATGGVASGNMATSLRASTASQTTPAPDTSHEIRPTHFYEDFFKLHGPNKPKTEEEMKREEAKAKRDKIFGSISDGIQALSNLYFTTRDAPDSYDPRNSLSEKAQARYDKIKAERDARAREYYQGWLKAVGLDRAQQDADRDYNMKIDQLKERQEYNLMLQGMKADQAKAKAKQWAQEQKRKEEKDKADAEYRKERLQMQKEHNEGMRALRAQANAISASKGRGGGGGSRRNYGGGGYHGGGTGSTKGQNTIRLADENIYSYGKDKEGALLALVPEMISRAKKASKFYIQQAKWHEGRNEPNRRDEQNERAMYYSNLAQNLENAKTKDAKLALLSENAYLFRHMDAKMRKALGLKATKWY